jgi:hypothetical protein
MQALRRSLAEMQTIILDKCQAAADAADHKVCVGPCREPLHPLSCPASLPLCCCCQCRATCEHAALAPRLRHAGRRAAGRCAQAAGGVGSVHVRTRSRRRASSLSAFGEAARRDAAHALPPSRAHVNCTDTRMWQEVQRLTKVMTKVGLGEQAIRRFTDFIARRVDGDTVRQVCPRTCLVSLCRDSPPLLFQGPGS